MTTNAASPRLTEEFVQDCFHSYLKSSLTQVKLEGLLTPAVLSSAEGDLMVTGPALCLYFAALKCKTNPPSVPLPKRRDNTDVVGKDAELSEDNCPELFLPFLRVWSDTVPAIKGLRSEHQHDLALIICGLKPIGTPNLALAGIAADLRAVAIEISQRRTFQNRYADDLQAAIDAGRRPSSSHLTATFVPPPAYVPAPLPASPPLYQPDEPPASSPPRLPDRQRRKDRESPPLVPLKETWKKSRLFLFPSSPRPPSQQPASPRSPYLSEPSTPAIKIIRETLYAALADVIERSRPIQQLMKSDPPRAYFASVAFAILDVATRPVTRSGGIRGVMGQELTVEKCPEELKEFMIEFVAIGSAVAKCKSEDDANAIEIISRGEVPPEPVMERTRKVLERGVGHNRSEGRMSVEGRALTLANRINALALGMTRLEAFRERQHDVFSVLSALKT